MLGQWDSPAFCMSTDLCLPGLVSGYNTYRAAADISLFASGLTVPSGGGIVYVAAFVSSRCIVDKNTGLNQINQGLRPYNPGGAFGPIVC